MLIAEQLYFHGTNSSTIISYMNQFVVKSFIEKESRNNNSKSASRRDASIMDDERFHGLFDR